MSFVSTANYKNLSITWRIKTQNVFLIFVMEHELRNTIRSMHIYIWMKACGVYLSAESVHRKVRCSFGYKINKYIYTYCVCIIYITLYRVRLTYIIYLIYNLRSSAKLYSMWYNYWFMIFVIHIRKCIYILSR